MRVLRVFVFVLSVVVFCCCVSSFKFIESLVFLCFILVLLRVICWFNIVCFFFKLDFILVNLSCVLVVFSLVLVWVISEFILFFEDECLEFCEEVEVLLFFLFFIVDCLSIRFFIVLLCKDVLVWFCIECLIFYKYINNNF